MSFNLKPLTQFKGRPGPLMVIVMDGIGIGKEYEGNAVYMAKTPVLDKLFKSELYTQLRAHGTAVGLPSDDDMGNSEVGHNALGAGRVFAQGAKRVNQAIHDGSIFKSAVWTKIASQCKTKDSALHFIGLLSDGNVHSHINHLIAMIRQADTEGIAKLRVHVLLDGRDVPEKSAPTYIDMLESHLDKFRAKGRDYKIASGGGRMVTTMDRYFANWDVVKKGWDAHVLGKGRQFKSAREAVETYYTEDPKMTDQYMDSFVVADNGIPVGTIEDGDCVVFFNFRGDRAIEITMAFENEQGFGYFDRVRFPKVFYAGMMQYDGDLKLPSNFLVDPPTIDRTVGEYLCTNQVTCFAMSETQKYGHVTYFWNGNRSGYIDEKLEKYLEIPSDKIQFDQAPKMKAREITDKAKELLKSGLYKFGRINLANGDMVGHTGIMPAAITAVETVDTCVGELIDVVASLGGITVVTADHGNADIMYTEKNGKKEVQTAHTLNPVPFVIIDSGYKGEYKMADIDQPGLANVASTICNLLGFEAPEGYEPSLIEFK